MEGVKMNKITVERDLTKDKATGKAYFRSNGALLDTCDVVTGHHQLDPEKYGGQTPPGLYVLIKQVERRKTGHYDQVCSILFPCDDLEYDYEDRTFWRLEVDPFRWHHTSKSGGRSTGCVCPTDKARFNAFNELINNAISNGEVVYVEVIDV